MRIYVFSDSLQVFQILSQVFCESFNPEDCARVHMMFDAFRVRVRGLVFAVTLLASGIASSTTGTLAGQSLMQDLSARDSKKYIRRLVTRVINVFPTTLASYSV